MFGTADSQDVRGGAGEAVGHERGRAGIADRRARRARVPAGAGRDRAVPRSRTSTTCAHNRRLSRLQGAFFPTMSLFLGVSALLALWLGSRDVMSGRITVGELVAFNAYLAQLAWPMIAFGWVTNLLERGMASWKRMLMVMETVPAIRDESTDSGLGALGSGPVRAPPHHGRDRVSEPQFPLRRPRSPERRLVLGEGRRDGGHRRRHRVGQVHARESAAAAAQPAARHGVHRRPRRARHSAGRAARRHRVRAAGAVPVFRHARRQRRVRRAGAEETSIRSGSRRRRPWRSSTRTCATSRRATRRWSASAGITLSGGQKQRTAIARAVVIDPRILILDDALSAVDTYTEEEILSRLRGVMQARTAIIISHRISTVRDADQIVVLEAGRLVEKGQARRTDRARRRTTRSCTRSSCWRRNGLRGCSAAGPAA